MSRPYSRSTADGVPDRILSVGAGNELQIRDAMGDFESTRPAKFHPSKRI
jgi:hypothetical protein